MKREGYIFPRICCKLNIRRAAINASKNKKHKRVVRKINANLDKTVDAVQEILLNGFTPTPYKVSTIYDGARKKERRIEKPVFYPDQIIHWALIQQIQPLIMRGMYEWSCGSIPGRGQRRCKQGVERWLRNDPENTRYCLKIDIRHFYQSIDNELLKAKFRRIIKDRQALALIDTIVDSTKGLNIGNFTSQWFANFYLQDADHFIKEKLRHFERHTKRGEITKTDGVIYYARYVDDMVLFGRNKKNLRKARERLFAYLQDELHLEIKPNWQLFLITETRRKRDGTEYQAGRDLDFLGYRMNHECTTLRRSLSLRISRRARKIAKKEKPTVNDAAAMVSYNGFIIRSDSYNYYRKRIKPYVSMERMKGMIAYETRKKQRHARAKPG